MFHHSLLVVILTLFAATLSLTYTADVPLGKTGDGDVLRLLGTANGGTVTLHVVPNNAAITSPTTFTVNTIQGESAHSVLQRLASAVNGSELEINASVFEDYITLRRAPDGRSYFGSTDSGFPTPAAPTNVRYTIENDSVLRVSWEGVAEVNYIICVRNATRYSSASPVEVDLNDIVSRVEIGEDYFDKNANPAIYVLPDADGVRGPRVMASPTD